MGTCKLFCLTQIWWLCFAYTLWSRKSQFGLRWSGGLWAPLPNEKQTSSLYLLARYSADVWRQADRFASGRGKCYHFQATGARLYRARREIAGLNPAEVKGRSISAVSTPQNGAKLLASTFPIILAHSVFWAIVWKACQGRHGHKPR